MGFIRKDIIGNKDGTFSPMDFRNLNDTLKNLFIKVFGNLKNADLSPDANIDGGKLKAESVSTRELEAECITTDKIKVGSLEGKHIKGERLEGVTITAKKEGENPNNWAEMDDDSFILYGKNLDGSFYEVIKIGHDITNYNYANCKIGGLIIEDGDQLKTYMRPMGKLILGEETYLGSSLAPYQLATLNDIPSLAGLVTTSELNSSISSLQTWVIQNFQQLPTKQ